MIEKGLTLAVRPFNKVLTFDEIFFDSTNGIYNIILLITNNVFKYLNLY
jgi:hypothetical protein